MKHLFHLLLFFLPFSLFAVNDDVYLKKIETAQTDAEKEAAYLDWISANVQKNTLRCDSILKQKKNFASRFTEDGRFTLLLLNYNNIRCGGLEEMPQIEEFELSPTDLLLARGLNICFNRTPLPDDLLSEIKANIDKYNDPTRQSVYYAVMSCEKGLTSKQVINSFNKALKHAKRSHLKSIYTSVLDVISNFYLQVENFEEAIFHQQKGVAYSKKHNLRGDQVKHLVNLGKILFQFDDLEKSEGYLLDALKLSSNLKLDYISGQLYNQLGELYTAQGKREKGIRFYQQAILKFYVVNNTWGLAQTHQNIGRAFYKQGFLDLAEKNYKLSEDFYSKLNHGETKGDLYNYLAELYSNRGKLSLAKKYINKSIAFWRESDMLIPLNDAYYLKSVILSKSGDLAEAYHFLNKYQLFRDSTYALETKSKIAELSEMFMSEQNERKILEQERKLAEESSQRLLIQNKLENSKQQTRLIIALFIISLVLFVAIVVIIRNKNRQEQLIKKQREIELQQTLLRTQMNPHFIFNAMSVIQSYIYDEDTANSSKFLIHFSKLMRMILENNAKQFIPLETELEIINRYLVLQKMRFEDRFDFEVKGNESIDATSTSIPPMLVQPFIENAIEHGDLDKVDKGKVKVTCEIYEDLFIFTIEDNGIGRQQAEQKKKKPSSESHRSMAVELTQSRILLLNEKYKSKGYLKIEDLDTEKGTGTKVTIATPYIKNI